MTETEHVSGQPADGHGEVVCAILGASGDEAAAKLGARLADQLSLRLALVRVEYLIAPPDAMALAGSQPMAPLAPVTPVVLAREPVVAPEPAKPEPWEHELGTSQPPRRDAVPGPPGEALRALSEAPGTRLLVACDRGGGPLASKLKGNAARDVMRHIGCPLVLVAADHAVTWSDPPDIVCAIDEGEEREAAVALAAELTRRLDSRLHVVHVVAPPVPGEPPRLVETQALDDDRRRRTETTFEACHAALSPNTDASFVAVEGDTADGLRFAAGELGAGLIVIGRPSRTALGSALLGSCAHDLLRDGAVTVVIAPHTGPEAARPQTGSREGAGS